MNKKILLAGNPNVGKSTIFNYLTKSKQHTGNWAGKTVGNKEGILKNKKDIYHLYDLPGIYSLLPHSEEEKLARDLLIFEEYDYIIVVCDSSSLLRNLNLVLQLKEIDKDIVLCLNLIDEAKKKKININIKLLESILGIKVIESCGQDKNSLRNIKNFIFNYKDNFKRKNIIKYSTLIEEKITLISKVLDKYNVPNKRFISLNILRKDAVIIEKINYIYKIDILSLVKDYLIDNSLLDEEIVEKINDKASDIYDLVVFKNNDNDKVMLLDRIFTNKYLGTFLMIIFLGIIFLLTIKISNYPSEMLFTLFNYLEKYVVDIFGFLPSYILDLVVNGVYKVTTWVISVMLPPMLIFFPLFTLLEEAGYLPRIAFNLDGIFRKCSSCGKQALTMAMGFGCNCVGVTNARIIDSKRERLIAILTNVFMPCNGKFPTLIVLITLFLSFGNDFISCLILLLLVLCGILVTFIISKILSITLLKGNSSSFVLELTPYRKPKVFKTIIKSIYDKALSILGRAVIVSIPTGILIWILSNIYVNNLSIFNHLISFLNPVGKVFGLDGVILISFILGFPANEIILPIMLMGYLNSGTLVEYSSLVMLKDIFISNGWNILTGISVLILMFFHYPCATACLTIKKETNSWFYMFLSMIIPTLIGLGLCLIINLLFGGMF